MVCITDYIIWMQIFNCFGYQFCLHFEAFHLGAAPVYMAFLRFMGDENDANKFSYSLEVGGNGRKMKWQGIPRSIRDSHQTVRDSLDGLIITRNIALFFSGGDRQELKLKVSGRIWKEQSWVRIWKKLHSSPLESRKRSLSTPRPPSFKEKKGGLFITSYICTIVFWWIVRNLSDVNENCLGAIYRCEF